MLKLYFKVLWELNVSHFGWSSHPLFAPSWRGNFNSLELRGSHFKGAATPYLLPCGEVIFMIDVLELVILVWNLEVAILKEKLPPVYSLVER